MKLVCARNRILKKYIFPHRKKSYRLNFLTLLVLQRKVIRQMIRLWIDPNMKKNRPTTCLHTSVCQIGGFKFWTVNLIWKIFLFYGNWFLEDWRQFAKFAKIREAKIFMKHGMRVLYIIQWQVSPNYLGIHRCTLNSKFNYENFIILVYLSI